METKSFSIGRKETEDMILDNLLPAILSKWSAWEPRRIRIQLDNAQPHPKPGNLKKRIADRITQYSAEGWDIGFALQPANSLDLNTLDLGFFRAIQSLQYQKPAKNLDEMIEIVHEAYTDLPLDVCKNLWTKAQLGINQVLLLTEATITSSLTLESLKSQPPTAVISRCGYRAVR